MANTFKLGNGNWATKEDSVLAYNDENNNFKPLPFDFTRASTATYVDSDGLIKTSRNGEARIDYTDSSDGALLLEPSRSNLVTYSEDFSQWNKTENNGTVTLLSSTEISPRGIADAYKVEFTLNDLNTGEVNLNMGTISGLSGNLTFSYYLKADVPTQIMIRNPLNNGLYTFIDVTTKWERYELTTNASSTTLPTIGLRNVQSNPNLSSTIYIFGAQVEAGSYATSYIPTSGSAVTRVAEGTSQTPPNGVIGQTEGSIYSEFKCLDSVANLILWMRNPSGGHYGDMIKLEVNASNTFRLEIREGNVNSTNITSSVLTVGNYYKVAVAYKQNNFAVYINGVQIGTDTSGNVPTCSEMYIGKYIDGGIRIGDVKSLKLYNTRLTNAELASLTT